MVGAQGVGGPQQVTGHPATGPAGRARRLRLAAAWALLGWTAFGFARATAEATSGWLDRRAYVASPAIWRLGAPQSDRLARCLASALEVIPPGEPLAVAWRRPNLYFWRWAAYLLPDRDVLARVEGDGIPVGYLVTFGPAPSAGERVRGGGWCAVYRLR
jgi:hypothetical protein